MATGSMPAATAAAPPELDQPGTRLVSQGLRASASQLKGLKMPSPDNAPPPPAPSMLLVPMMIAPDFLRRSTPKRSFLDTGAGDRKSTRQNSSHTCASRKQSSAC